MNTLKDTECTFQNSENGKLCYLYFTIEKTVQLKTNEQNPGNATGAIRPLATQI